MHGNRYIPIDDRVRQRFALGFEPAGEDECWEWKGGLFPTTGYGQINVKWSDGRWSPTTAHRLAYELANGPLPPGIEVRHTCDNRPCCNPAHLLSGTSADNSADMTSRNRQSRGEQRPLAKLTEEAVLSIRASTLPQKVLAEQHGISQKQVSYVKNRKQWGHV